MAFWAGCGWGTVHPGSSHGIIVISHRCQKNAPGTERTLMIWKRNEVLEGILGRKRLVRVMETGVDVVLGTFRIWFL